MFPKGFKLPLLPSEVIAEKRAAKKAATPKPRALAEIKAEVLGNLNLAATEDLKKILVAKGIKLNLTRRDSWEVFLDATSGVAWVVAQEAKRRRFDRGAALERITEKKLQNDRDFKYRTAA